jgi:hypothetical protein
MFSAWWALLPLLPGNFQLYLVILWNGWLTVIAAVVVVCANM